MQLQFIRSASKMTRKFLDPLPSGPLDRYRKCASFDWKKMKIFLASEELVQFNEELVNKLEQNVNLNPSISAQTLDKERYVSANRMKILRELNIFNREDALVDPRRVGCAVKTLFQWDPSTSVKYLISDGMVPGVLTSLGTERHYQYLEDTIEGTAIACFCLTEISHGTNTKAMRTTATYNKESQQFILNTPDFEAAKCWVGNLGKVATYGIVYAQLYTPDGKCHGLHNFVVDIRDKTTLKAYPGIIVGDMGPKGGLNGIDNGFIIFKNYRIPRENLLNKTGDVTPEGKYVSPLKDPSKRFGISLGALSSGRINIINLGNSYLEKAITIAIRYAGIRKQFGPDDKEELPILEYQLHQWRLLPYLAVGYVLNQFTMFIGAVNVQFQIDTVLGGDKDKLSDLGTELHAISSAGKAVSSWVIRDAIQECRESCGGHGYLKVSELTELRNNHDANCTYEGESNVLCQQTSNWLLKFWPSILRGQNINPTPLGSINYLNDALNILKTTFNATTVEEACSPKNVIEAYKWLVCYLLKESYNKFQTLISEGKDPFTAKNNAQIYHLRTLSIVFIEQFFMQKVIDKIDTATDDSIRLVLWRLLSLYGAWSLDKHMTILYQGGYAKGPQPAYLIKKSILNLCEQIKPDAVSLVDAIAPHDFVMKSPLGKSDGEVYKHLELAFLNEPEALSRPDWWREIVDHKQYTPISKL